MPSPCLMRSRALASVAAIAVIAVLLPVGPASGAAPDEGEPSADLIAPDRGAPSAGDAALVPGSLIVTTTSSRAADRLPERARAALARRGPGRVGFAERLAERVVALEVPPGEEAAAIAALQAESDVVEARQERRYSYTARPDDPRYDEQWAHTMTGAEQAWAITQGSYDVTVAVLDSGMVGTHPDLEGNIKAQVDASHRDGVVDRGLGVDNATCPDGSGATGIAHRHGTWVGGVVGAVGDNGVGVAGVAWRVSMLDVALSSDRDPDSCLGPKDSAILRALRWVRDRPSHEQVDVVNLSLGGPQARCPSDLQSVLDELRSAGTLVVAAAGNEGAEGPSVPASCEGVLAVGAVGADGRIAGYSNRAAYLSLAAPGGGDHCSSATPCVLTTDRSGGYDVISGTSFAAPYVAGVAALVRSVRPALSPDRTRALLEETATKRNPHGERDLCYGWGVVQAGAALQRLAAGGPLPERPVARGFGQVASDCGTATEPVGQATAMSRAVFGPAGARHVVLARSDDYADALAGSALGYGVGPILFNAPSGGLDLRNRAEITRVLPPGGVVYLLGGPSPLDAQIEADARNLSCMSGPCGYQVRRIAGQTREHTAVAASRELERRLVELGQGRNPAVILATRGNWADAVAAGSLASFFGLPVLLTTPGQLHSATAAELDRLRGIGMDRLYVIGGQSVVSDATADAARRAAGLPGAQRLGGPARDHTAVEVAREMIHQLPADLRPPPYAIGVNLDRADGYAHALSASALAGRSGSIFVPFRGLRGDMLTTPAREVSCGLGARALLAGGTDLLATAEGTELADLLRGAC